MKPHCFLFATILLVNLVEPPCRAASGIGIAGFDLLANEDQGFTFDYNGDGDDDLFFYRRGGGIAWVASAIGDGTYTPVYRTGVDSAQGMCGFSFNFLEDHAFAFDINGDGKDELFFYRPGSGAAIVVSWSGGIFSKTAGTLGDPTAPGTGIAGWALRNSQDALFPIDFNNDGKDDLFYCRPGSKLVGVALSDGSGGFSKVIDSTTGFLGFDFSNPNDRGFRFDFDGDGDDDLFLYRPGGGVAWVAKQNSDGTFKAVFRSGISSPQPGIAGYDLMNALDLVVPFDYDGDGKQDLLLYRHSKGIAYVARSNGDGSFSTIYTSGAAPASGIGGYDLMNGQDLVFPLRYDNDAYQELFCYRPGKGLVALVRSLGNGEFAWMAGAPYMSNQLKVQAAFDWAMPDRFGLDKNQNGMIDLPNTRQYVLNYPANEVGGPGEAILGRYAPAKFTLVLDATASIARNSRGDAVPITGYTWSIHETPKLHPNDTGLPPGTVVIPEAFATVHSSASPIWEVQRPEGPYTVTLTVQAEIDGAIVKHSVTTKIFVKDLLIVCMGDSFSSGEGNPERSEFVRIDDEDKYGIATWADDGVTFDPREERTQQVRDNRRSHRSTLSYSAQAALDIERADSHTSVTYINVAASGSKIQAGILTNYFGVEPGLFAYFLSEPMPSQLAQITTLVGNRKIDALTFSIGINDIGFSDILRQLIILDPVIPIATVVLAPITIPPEWLSLGYDGALNRLFSDGEDNIDRLEVAYQKLAEGMHIVGLDLVFNTYIIEYPDPMTHWAESSLLDTCDEILEDIQFPLEISKGEQQDARNRLLVPLNLQIARAGAEHGWIPIAQRDSFNGHGYCADAPYAPRDYPGNPFPGRIITWPAAGSVRFFRKAQESKRIQGPDDVVATSGTIHPNEFGHQAVKYNLLKSMVLPIDIPGVTKPDPDDQIAEATIISLPTTSAAISQIGSIYPGGDVDMFKFQIQSRHERWTFKGLQRDPGFDPLIQLFDAEGRLLAFNDNEASVTTASKVSYTFTEPGWYAIAVSSSGNWNYDPDYGWGDVRGKGTGNYTLQIQHEPSDNTIAQAITMPPGANLENFAIETNTDLDLFRYELTRNTYLHFFSDVEGPSTVKRMRIFDAAGTELASSSSGSLAYRFQNEGIYFLGISTLLAGNYNANTGSPVQAGAPSAYKIRVVSSVDPDDQVSEAFSIPQNFSSLSGFGLFPVTDVDMFATRMGSDEAISITLSDPELLIRIFNSSGIEVASGLGEVMYAPPQSGDLYFGISGSDNTSYIATSGLGDLPASIGQRNGAALGDHSPYTISLDRSSTLPLVSLSSLDKDALEGSDNSARFTIRRIGSISNPLTVFLKYLGGAINGVDYATLPASVTISAGSASIELAVRSLEDSLVEGMETVTVSVLPDARYLAPSSGLQLRIVDNEANQAPNLAWESPSPNAEFYAHAMIPLRVAVTDIDGAVARVEYFEGGSKLGESSVAPFEYRWDRVSPGIYELTARAWDNAGATATSTKLVATVRSRLSIHAGRLKKEIYTGLAGSTLTELTSAGKFPASPDITGFLDTFELPALSLDQFGARLSGFIQPPVSGPYLFYLCSDGEGALFLSLDHSPGNKRQIANEPQWNPARTWTGGERRPNNENVSARIFLEAGNWYYIEALMKHGSGTENLGVAWQLPRELSPANGSLPIDGEFLGVAEFGKIPPAFSDATIGEGATVELNGVGDFGQDYVLQKSSDMRIWTDVARKSVDAYGRLRFSDGRHSSSNFFYRIIVK